MVTELWWKFRPTYGSVNTEDKQWIKKTVSEGKKHQPIPPSGQETTEKKTCREKKWLSITFNDWLSLVKRQSEVAGIG